MWKYKYKEVLFYCDFDCYEILRIKLDVGLKTKYKVFYLLGQKDSIGFGLVNGGDPKCLQAMDFLNFKLQIIVNKHFPSWITQAYDDSPNLWFDFLTNSFIKNYTSLPKLCIMTKAKTKCLTPLVQIFMAKFNKFCK